MKTLYLVDGHSHIYQAFYAIRGISGPRGEPVNAIYGVAGMLMKLIRQSKPDYLAVAMDEAAPTFRREAFAEYKAQRKPMPDDLVAQLPVIREMLGLMGIRVISVPGFEGDDIVGTLVERAKREGFNVVMVTRDKDFRQLLGPNAVMYDPKSEKTFDEAALMQADGIRPEQVPEVFGLSGDTSDNIPGVPGIGPKTAKELIRKYGTVDNVLEHLDDFKGKRAQMLREHADKARLSRELATIRLDTPLDVGPENLSYKGFDRAGLAELFRRYGFRRFAEGLDDKEQQAPASKVLGAYRLISTEDELAGLVAELEKRDSFAVDTETTSREPTRAELVGISVAWEPGKACYVPVAGGGIGRERIVEMVRGVLEDPKRAKVGQNIKYDMIVIERAGIKLRGIDFDTMVAAYVLDPGGRRFGIDELAQDYLGVRKTKTSELLGKGSAAITMDQVDVAQVADYACEDADVTWRLRAKLMPKLAETGLSDIFAKIEMPLVPVLAEMEQTGVYVDGDQLAVMSREIETEAADIEKQIYAEAGETFNIASPKQLSEILFTRLGLPKLKRTKEGYSTASDVLQSLAPRHPIASLVLRYRQLMKLKTTYVDALPRMTNPATGRIHASFNQTATATGRLSASDPNLQNIPIRTPLGSRIREAFVPQSADDVLLTADYSQIELRFMAHFSRDESLVKAFERGEDIHSVVAAEIFRVPREEVTEELRGRAKAVDFGILYGLSAYGLSQSTGLPVGEAQDFIDAYFERYPGVEKFITRALEETRDKGFVETIAGRRRYISGIKSTDGRARNLPERTAINTVIQGSAADLIKAAMINIHRRIKEEGRPSRLILQVHDELVFEVPKTAVEDETGMVRDEMTGAMSLAVPLEVKCAHGSNWLEAK